MYEDYDDPYCPHGKYVGGCGIDYMCGWCESGTPWNEYLVYLNHETRKRTHGNMMATIFSAQPLSSLNVPRVVMNMTRGLLLAPCNKNPQHVLLIATSPGFRAWLNRNIV